MSEPALTARPTPEAAASTPLRAAAPERRPALAASALSEVPGVMRIAPVQRRTRLILRGRAGEIGSAGSALGLTMPVVSNHSASSSEADVLWLGPTEWLILGEDGQADSFCRRIAAALAQVPHALVDVSHRQFGLSIAGARGADVIAAGCPLDLRLSRFPARSCSRTLYGKAEIILWRTAEDAFEAETTRAFAKYLFSMMQEAAQDLGIV